MSDVAWSILAASIVVVAAARIIVPCCRFICRLFYEQSKIAAWLSFGLAVVGVGLAAVDGHYKVQLSAIEANANAEAKQVDASLRHPVQAGPAPQIAPTAPAAPAAPAAQTAPAVQTAPAAQTAQTPPAPQAAPAAPPSQASPV